jgi:hypothetical protein
LPFQGQDGRPITEIGTNQIAQGLAGANFHEEPCPIGGHLPNHLPKAYWLGHVTPQQFHLTFCISRISSGRGVAVNRQPYSLTGQGLQGISQPRTHLGHGRYMKHAIDRQ